MDSTPLNATASAYFGGMAESYDSLIRRAVPRYDEMIETLIEYLPPRAVRIMELGCGTGNLSLRLAARYPDAALTLVDAAPEMVDLTRARLAERAPAAVERARFETARFEELRPDAGAYDLVVSTISLHHVVDKGALFATLRRGLAPGGTLRFADQLRGATERNHRLNWERWLDFCRRDCTEEEVRSLVEHAERHDHYVSLQEHFRLLASAGFGALDCVWRHGMWGIVTADAP